MPSTDRHPAMVHAELLSAMRSLQLATVGLDGEPHCGYTPYLYQAPCTFYLFVSQLAAHTRDLVANGRAAIMIIEDEEQSNQIFARARASYQCRAEVVRSSATEYDPVLNEYQARHGKMAGLLRQLPDFLLIRLRPFSGRFVMGFGQAFRLSGEHLSVFEHTKN